ncbi:unnamed protein product [Acanthoscelides obtectus]|uniref:Uncharacterized protein n=1 Tax=Acanthoscelides obtectus TaxID=200917 RepID=A0A9P0KDW7_ACAOB|nr:unnamed protein product [Acanthoscelides obtectus]CAK1650984.1 hypothetical protein AOBTE_LOCUS17000 [Acanthoscelides obtectus]
MNIFLYRTSLFLTSKILKSKSISVAGSCALHIHQGKYFSTEMRDSSSMLENKDIFNGKTDRYKGVTVHSDQEKCNDIDEFKSRLQGTQKVY